MGKIKNLMIELHDAESKGYKVDWEKMKVIGPPADVESEASEAAPGAQEAAHEKSSSTKRTACAGHSAGEKGGSGSL